MKEINKSQLNFFISSAETNLSNIDRPENMH